MTVAGFPNWFRECARDAGLSKNCTPHGLRKAGCVRLAVVSRAPHQIMAIGGHKALAEVGLYTREFENNRISDETIQRWRSAPGTKR